MRDAPSLALEYAGDNSLVSYANVRSQTIAQGGVSHLRSLTHNTLTRFWKLFSAASPKRIYLRHLNKRAMRTSIVEIVCLSVAIREKPTLLPLV